MSFFIVDVEAKGPCPSLGVMTEFGAVLLDAPPFNTRFHGQGVPTPVMMQAFASWISESNGQGWPIFVSDNPAFDWMWMNDAFWRYYGSNPFGHSARRIGDIYSGYKRDLRKASEWKRLRVTKHDHHPVHDALGNAEALWKIIEMMKGTEEAQNPRMTTCDFLDRRKHEHKVDPYGQLELFPPKEGG